MSDITALSQKYGDLRHKKSFSYDRLSTLEQKYLTSRRPRKSSTECETSEGQDYNKISPEPDLEKQKYDSASLKRRGSDLIGKPSEQNGSYTGHKRKEYLHSGETSVDEQLTSYMNKTSLMGDKDKVGDVQVAKSPSGSGSSEDSMDEVINFNNILTIDDILNRVPDVESRNPYDDVKEEEINSESGNIDINHRGPWQKEIYKTDEKKNSLVKSGRSSSQSSIHSDDEGDSDQLVGILLAQASQNIFRSSRRKSSIEFNFDSILKTKSVKEAMKSLSRKNSQMCLVESVAESIASSNESNIAEDLVESNHSSSGEGNQSVEENLASTVRKSTEKVHMAGEDTQEGTTMNSSGNEGGKSVRTTSSQTRKGSHGRSLQENKSALPFTSGRQRAGSYCQSDGQCPGDASESRANIKHGRKSNNRSGSRNHSPKKSKHKKKHRSSTSEGTSSTNESSLSDSTTEPTHRYYSKHLKHRWKYGFNPWVSIVVILYYTCSFKILSHGVFTEDQSCPVSSWQHPMCQTKPATGLTATHKKHTSPLKNRHVYYCMYSMYKRNMFKYWGSFFQSKVNLMQFLIVIPGLYSSSWLSLFLGEMSNLIFIKLLIRSYGFLGVQFGFFVLNE